MDPLNSTTIRSARLEDAEMLHLGCYPEDSFVEIYRYLDWCLRPAQKGRITRLVAEVDGQVVGNIQLTVWGQTGEIGSLVVAPALRQQGLGWRLLSETIGLARQRGLASLEIAVRQDKPAILAFYHKMGFRPIQGAKKGLSRPASLEPVVQLRMRL
jgi:ribosomal protein S18 acetylase RimI-like enzyme